MEQSPVKSVSVSTGTEHESLSHLSTSRRPIANEKKDKQYEALLKQDFVDSNEPNDIERLRKWCSSQWSETIRKSLLNRNQMSYHLCCNSFSRRFFCKSANHPTDETFDINKLKDFKSIETGEDLFRWQISMINENTKKGLRTPFPTINIKHFGSAGGQSETTDVNIRAQMTKRLSDLERDLDEHKRLIGHLRTENARLLRSSKNWHSLYEQTLGKRDQLQDLTTTPKKQKISNSFVFLEDN